MTQTPLQEAIANFRQEIKEMQKEVSATIEGKAIIAATVTYLQSLLPKEKELVRRCFDAGYNRRYEPEHYPSKEKFINQLYPEK